MPEVPELTFPLYVHITVECFGCLVNTSEQLKVDGCISNYQYDRVHTET